MSLREINDADLIFKVKFLVGEEKKTTQNILEYLTEIERRRLFAARGFSSLFEFCMLELGYSESSAQRRIASMRLIKTLPEAKERLISGKVNLSTLSQLQTFIKKEETYKNLKLDHDKKLDLLKIIENKTQKECEQEFIKISPVTAKAKEFIKRKTLEFAEIRFMASNELEAKLKKLNNLLSHQNKTHSISGLIEILADMALKDKAIAHKAGKFNKARRHGQSFLPTDKSQVGKATNCLTPAVSQNGTQAFNCSTPPFPQNKIEVFENPDQKNRKNILGPKGTAAAVRPVPSWTRREVKREIWKKDHGQCQYIDPLTKRKCLSEFKVQIDHIHPKALGGSDNSENLQLLCATHNQLRAIQIFSAKHMGRFVPDLK